MPFDHLAEHGVTMIDLAGNPYQQPQETGAAAARGTSRSRRARMHRPKCTAPAAAYKDIGRGH